MYTPGTIRIPGHEVVGTIAEIGEGVENYAVVNVCFARRIPAVDTARNALPATITYAPTMMRSG